MLPISSILKKKIPGRRKTIILSIIIVISIFGIVIVFNNFVTSNQQVIKEIHDYSFVNQWGKLGTADGEFDGPTAISVDSSGNVYVADLNNNRIQKFDSNGTFITKWGTEWYS